MALLGSKELSNTLGSSLNIDSIIPENQSGSDVGDWLNWCRKNKRVKVVDFKVPDGILPVGYSGTLHDVKVESRGPDDKVYNSNPEIREKIARGNCVLSYTNCNASNDEQTMDMVTFALRKFTGGMGDEDETQPENAHVWQRYFIKPMEEVKEIVVMNKENGEAAHFSARLIGGQFYFICGSKNVHMIFRNQEDIDKYVDSRFFVAKTVCETVLHTVNNMNDHQRDVLLSFLHISKMTAIMEILQPSYQHVVDLSHLDRASLKFLCFTAQYSSMESTRSLTSLPPHTALELGKLLGLTPTSYEKIQFEKFEEKELNVRGGRGFEGAVFYFLDSEENVIGLLKKKTSWYILLRAIREKVSFAMIEYKKHPGGFKELTRKGHMKKLHHRLDEIQNWLKLSDNEIAHWKTLGSNFLYWTVEQARFSPSCEVTSRGSFPNSWKKFLEQTGAKEVFDGSPPEDMTVGDVGECEAAVQLLEANPSSPIIIVQRESYKDVASACIVRNLDLRGRNLEKCSSILDKVHKRQCKDQTLGSVHLFNLVKLSSKLLLTEESLNKLVITTDQFGEVSGCELLRLNKDRFAKVLRSHVDTKTTFSVLTDGGEVLSIALVGSRTGIEPDDETTDILVLIHAPSSEQGRKVMDCVLLQLYHAKLGNSMQHDKSLIVEKVRMEGGDGESLEEYPTSLQFR